MLDRYLDALADAPFDALSRDAKLAFLINAYNACTLRLISTTGQSTRSGTFPHQNDGRRSVGASPANAGASIRSSTSGFGLTSSNRGSILPSCAPLRDVRRFAPEAYTGDRLAEQLAEQTRRVHESDRWIRPTVSGGLRLTRLYQWYAADFEAVAGSVKAYVERVAPERGAVTGHWEWLDYDWRLNDIGHPLVQESADPSG